MFICVPCPFYFEVYFEIYFGIYFEIYLEIYFYVHLEISLNVAEIYYIINNNEPQIIVQSEDK